MGRCMVSLKIPEYGVSVDNFENRGPHEYLDFHIMIGGIRILTFFWILSFCLLATKLYSQCNTTLNQLLPEASVNNEDRFGSALAANRNYLVVGAEDSDTLGVYYGGSTYLFERTPAGWAFRALLVPSNPYPGSFFGNKVAIDSSGNVVVVIDRRYPKGQVYIYEKSPGGWATMTETTRIELPDFLEHNSPVSISEDGRKIVVGSPGTNEAKFYILHQSGTSWENPILEIVEGPDLDSHSNIFSIQTIIKGDYLYVSSDNDPTGSGIYVYKRTETGYIYLAKLSQTIPFGQSFYYGRYLTATEDMVATVGIVYTGDEIGNSLFIYKRNGEWKDTVETTRVLLPEFNASYRFPFPLQIISSNEIAASILVPDDEYYKGNLILVTSIDGKWKHLSTEVIHEEPGLSQRSEFALNLVWNGSRLIRSIGRSSIGSTYRNSVVTMRRINGVWGGLEHTTIPRKNGSQFFYGQSIIKTDQGLLVGSPYDGMSGEGSGAVYVYEVDGSTYTKAHAIQPSQRVQRITGGRDAGFGYSLAVHGNELAVGAPSYLYSASSPRSYGKIFLYKRTTESWSSAVLVDSLSAPEELMLNHIGTQVAMTDNVLFASAYNNYNNEHTNAVIVYEKVSGKWTYKDVLYFGKPLDKSWPSVRLSVQNDMLVVGNFFTLGGGISFVKRNLITGKWEVIFSKAASLTSGYGGAVKLLDNHLFVGVPAHDYQGVPKSGVVYVYAKLPGQQWSANMEPVSILGAQSPVEGGYFGSSIDVIGNTLVVGAPGKFLTQDNQIRTVPGNTYIIQAEDYFWQHTIEFLNLQGKRFDNNEQDNFGAAVSVDEEMFFIGSRNENTPAGAFSGAVYYIPTPPVIFLVPPVCESADPIQLDGYPFGGMWSGEGILSTSGLFDPKEVGPGIAVLTYSTPNCAYEGRVQIEVGGALHIEQLSPVDSEICQDAELILQVSDIPEALYEWLFKPHGTNSFTSLGSGGSSYQVSHPGEYLAVVSNGLCSQRSAIFRVAIESDIQLVLGPQPVVCEPNYQVSLIAAPDIGVWEGEGILDGVFNSGMKSNGFYSFSYRFITPLGCTVILKDSIKINIMDPISIKKIPGDFCSTGSELLEVEVASSHELSFTWYYSESLSTGFMEIDKPLTHQATVYESGYYRVMAFNGECEGVSLPVEVGFDNTLSYQFTSENSVVQVCDVPAYTLTVTANAHTDYTWYFAANEAEDYSEIGSGVSSELTVEESGFYRVGGALGFCSFLSDPVKILFQNLHVLAPNVFTPNNDNFNDLFKFETDVEILSLHILNRYGERIFTTNNGSWNGDGYPSGIYYWLARFRGCDQEIREMKGWVHLMR